MLVTRRFHRVPPQDSRVQFTTFGRLGSILVAAATAYLLTPYAEAGVSSRGGYDITYMLDTKIYVEAGQEDCYYEYIHAKNVIYFTYRVINGGDGLIGASIKDPNGHFVLPHELKADGEYNNEHVQVPGYYQFCLDNRNSRFYSVLVNFYLTTYNEKQWEKYSTEFEALHLSAENSTASLTAVDSRITEMLKYLFISRAQESHDFALLQSNHFYVSFFSGLQCIIILVAGFVHVTILKSLFKEKSGGSGSGNIKVRI